MTKGNSTQQEEVILDEDLAKEKNRSSPKGYNKILTIPLKLLIAIILIGILFKLQHYQGAGIILTIGLMGFPALYTFRFAWKSSKRFKDFIKLVLVISLALGSYFKLMHYPYADYLLTVREVSLLIWLVLEGVDYFYFNKWDYPGLKVSGFPLLSASVIVAGLIFKLQHAQLASILLIIGFIGVATWFAKDAFFWLMNRFSVKKH